MRRLADQGCLEVTLLGQTVNSYKCLSGGRTVRLSDLLELLDRIEGIRRLRFVTNYPRHVTLDLLQAVRDLRKVSPYLHVPVQSGSDEVLRRMKRGYTVAQYRDMLQAIHETVPRAAIASDFIVGFCGETEEEFAKTVDLVRERGSRTALFSSTALVPEPRATPCMPTTCRKRSSGGETTISWPCRTRSARS